jgi:hypothetical protein
VSSQNVTVKLTLPSVPLMVPAKAMPVIAALARDYVELGLITAAGVIAEHAPANTGHLRQSFGANPATTTGGIELLGGTAASGPQAVEIVGRVFSSLPYAAVMDEGRRPNRPISRAGVASIGLWVRRKLGLSGKEAQRAMYAISWAIRTRGIAPRHYMAKAKTAFEPKMADIMRSLDVALAEALTRKGA